MAASMYKMKFQYKDIIFTLALEESIFSKIKTDENYIKELFDYLIAQGTLNEKGLPNDVNVSEIRMVGGDEDFPIYNPEEPNVIIYEDENSVQDIKEKDGEEASQNDIGSAGTFRWKRPQIMKLLAAYNDHNEDFQSPQYTGKKVWAMIGAEMRAAGIQITDYQAETKLKNLKKTYRTVKRRNNTSGNDDRREWEFYELMEQAVGNKSVSNHVTSFSTSPAEDLLESEVTNGLTSPSSPSKSSVRHTLTCSTPSTSSVANYAASLAKKDAIIRNTKKNKYKRSLVKTAVDEVPPWVESLKDFFAERRRERDEQRSKLLNVLEKLVEQKK